MNDETFTEGLLALMPMYRVAFSLEARHTFGTCSDSRKEFWVARVVIENDSTKLTNDGHGESKDEAISKAFAAVWERAVVLARYNATPK